MNKTTKLTLEELVAKKEQAKRDKLAIKDVYVDALGGCLGLQKLPVTRFLSIMGKYDNENFTEAVACEVELVYAACPMLQKEALTQDLAEPTDIVLEILGDDLGALGTLAGAVTGFYGLDETGDAVKN